MVTFPAEFVATKYSGYFWNLTTKTLYSIKVDGVLKEIARSKPNFFNHQFDGYRVSVKGVRRNLTLAYLMQLTANDSVIPVQVNVDT